ncbi:hypothetical protein CYMTET_14470 [Cymbomonas tetramitiformis]|uniref:Uncharacterized protein n=1 Tax=Cymbomonas tetramitiformis TaxID=36881 RepID=A0AAE0GGI7_9CHLO|nr:hypothetical protein CYMTET_14470 [Cymbomonas tetramitiformis]
MTISKKRQEVPGVTEEPPPPLAEPSAAFSDADSVVTAESGGRNDWSLQKDIRDRELQAYQKAVEHLHSTDVFPQPAELLFRVFKSIDGPLSLIHWMEQAAKGGNWPPNAHVWVLEETVVKEKSKFKHLGLQKDDVLIVTNFQDKAESLKISREDYHKVFTDLVTVLLTKYLKRYTWMSAEEVTLIKTRRTRLLDCVQNLRVYQESIQARRFKEVRQSKVQGRVQKRQTEADVSWKKHAARSMSVNGINGHAPPRVESVFLYQHIPPKPTAFGPSTSLINRPANYPQALPRHAPQKALPFNPIASSSVRLPIQEGLTPARPFTAPKSQFRRGSQLPWNAHFITTYTETGKCGWHCE